MSPRDGGGLASALGFVRRGVAFLSDSGDRAEPPNVQPPSVRHARRGIGDDPGPEALRIGLLAEMAAACRRRALLLLIASVPVMRAVDLRDARLHH